LCQKRPNSVKRDLSGTLYKVHPPPPLSRDFCPAPPPFLLSGVQDSSCSAGHKTKCEPKGQSAILEHSVVVRQIQSLQPAAHMRRRIHACHNRRRIHTCSQLLKATRGPCSLKCSRPPSALPSLGPLLVGGRARTCSTATRCLSASSSSVL
jgi:hypothetical protein